MLIAIRSSVRLLAAGKRTFMIEDAAVVSRWHIRDHWEEPGGVPTERAASRRISRDPVCSSGAGGQRPRTRADLIRIAQRLRVPVHVVEQDYVLTYVLAGIAEMRGL